MQDSPRASATERRTRPADHNPTAMLLAWPMCPMRLQKSESARIGFLLCAKPYLVAFAVVWADWLKSYHSRPTAGATALSSCVRRRSIRRLRPGEAGVPGDVEGGNQPADVGLGECARLWILGAPVTAEDDERRLPRAAADLPEELVRCAATHGDGLDGAVHQVVMHVT